MKCMSCGTEMNSTTGGNYTCPKCGQGINDGVYRPPTNNIYGEGFDEMKVGIDKTKLRKYDD